MADDKTIDPSSWEPIEKEFDVAFKNFVEHCCKVMKNYGMKFHGAIRRDNERVSANKFLEMFLSPYTRPSYFFETFRELIEVGRPFGSLSLTPSDKPRYQSWLLASATGFVIYPSNREGFREKFEAVGKKIMISRIFSRAEEIRLRVREEEDNGDYVDNNMESEFLLLHLYTLFEIVSRNVSSTHASIQAIIQSLKEIIGEDSIQESKEAKTAAPSGEDMMKNIVSQFNAGGFKQMIDTFTTQANMPPGIAGTLSNLVTKVTSTDFSNSNPADVVQGILSDLKDDPTIGQPLRSVMSSINNAEIPPPAEITDAEASSSSSSSALTSE